MLGQADKVVDSGFVCEEGVEAFIGELVGSTLTLGLAGKAASSASVAIAARPANSVWRLGNFARGFEIETKLFKAEQLLAKNFPTIDRFADGVATSIKSIDLTAKTYADTAALTRKLSGYVDELSGFSGGVSGLTRTGRAIDISQGAVKGRQLLLAIEPGAASMAQRLALKEAVASARGRGVDLVIRTVR